MSREYDLVQLWRVDTRCTVGRFVGKHCRKHGYSGVYATPSLQSITNSWYDYVHGKNPGKGLYLHKFYISREAFDEASRLRDAAKEASILANPECAYAAWGWDIECFIPDHLLHLVTSHSVREIKGRGFQSPLYSWPKGDRIKGIAPSVAYFNKLLAELFEIGVAVRKAGLLGSEVSTNAYRKTLTEYAGLTSYLRYRMTSYGVNKMPYDELVQAVKDHVAVCELARCAYIDSLSIPWEV
jgi:hypothetical protein